LETGEFARQPVDFEKLFLQGELQQNLMLAPDDYLYFPPLGPEEVYVLGEVGTTGVVPYNRTMTVIGAIAARGGFKEGAYRQKILVVRGNLQQPETFIVDATGVQQLRSALRVAVPDTTVVDTASTLRAATPDFALQPRDIIYVSRKPWAKAEELLQAASSDFVRAIVVAWTGYHIRPLSQ
jgi:protein involved in polysaccharide export with SLBB domain